MRKTRQLITENLVEGVPGRSCEVNDSIAWICQHLGLHPKLTYSGGERGWVGDSPFILLDCSRIRALGWRPRLTIQQAVLATIKYVSADATRSSA